MADAAHGSAAGRDAALAAMAAMAAALPGGTVARRARRPAARGAGALRRARRAGGGFALRANMTPMIDVVFQLLVFFIATTRFQSQERVIAMELGKRAAAPAQEPAPAPPRADPFRLDDEALRLEVAVDGSVRAGPPLRRTLTPGELRATLAAEIRLPGRRGGMFEPAFPVVIAPEPAAPWEAAVEALDAAVAAGFRNVGFEQAAGERGDRK
jgi:biopolymer transport protein ExbD